MSIQLTDRYYASHLSELNQADPLNKVILSEDVYNKQGKLCPAVITVYADKSFDFIIKNTPVPVQIKEALKLKSGSAEPNRVKVGKLTKEQVRAIAEDKMPDLNSFTIESAMQMVAGTARSMGIRVEQL